MTSNMRKILAGTLIAGTLDFAMAIIETLLKGKDPLAMLGGLASGPFPGAARLGLAGSALGLLVHYAIMAVMVTIFIVARDRVTLIRNHTLVAAALYGVGLWLVMYGVVLHFRFGVPFPSPDPVEIAKQLFAHVVLVGLAIGLVAKRG
jgi:hypothetical protein